MHLLTVRQAAALLHCHPYSIYAAIYEGRLSALKLKGNVRIPADEVERALSSQEKIETTLSVRKVARILTCSQSTILRLIRARKLKAKRTGGRFLITPEDLENYVLSLPNV